MKSFIILILTFLSLSLFAQEKFVQKEKEVKYVLEEANKTFETYKYFSAYKLVDEVENIRALVGEIKEEYAKNLEHYYKAVYNEHNRLIRLEEYRNKKLYGFFIYMYDQMGFETGLQYHYLGNIKVEDDKQKFFHIKVSMDNDTNNYMIEYFNKDRLVKREFFTQTGELLKAQNFKK